MARPNVEKKDSVNENDRGSNQGHENRGPFIVSGKIIRL